ncbi:MAG: UDP-4-amino-4,6-dideoxy-N-acetyl-beta-L-altrosamine transaminase [Oscillatoria sp. SIO1A7]|nr:UDP-4-amino-4,6-dideoxy-N-acetyl-beta-L-altrosamine transaminase [Oscillatoria sp. SIO1A7]
MNYFIPYGRQDIGQEDIDAVVEVLHSDWLTTGPKVPEFERAVAEFVGLREAVAVSSGTAALHAAMYALRIEPGDEVIVPAMTFVATANAVAFQRGIPVFADVNPETLSIDPTEVEAKITSRTKAIAAVDYAGHPCDYDALRSLAAERDLALVADACHALGGSYKGRPVGSLADLNTFSFHPVKQITTGEGGAIATNDPELAQRMRMFRNHGIATDHRQRAEMGTWYYDMVDLGYNYRITDFQSALGLSQLCKLPEWIARRQEIARIYDRAIANIPAVKPLSVSPDVSHAYHLYVIQLELEQLKADRETIFSALREEGIGVNVHYIPVHLHSFYRQQFGTEAGLCPVAEAAYEKIITLPIFPTMSDRDVEYVNNALIRVLNYYAK